MGKKEVTVMTKAELTFIYKGLSDEEADNLVMSSEEDCAAMLQALSGADQVIVKSQKVMVRDE